MALLSPKEQDGNGRYKTHIMPFYYCGQEGEGATSKSVHRGQKAKKQKCIKDACKERGWHIEDRGAKQWWFQLCTGEDFVYEGRKKESSLFDQVKSDFSALIELPTLRTYTCMYNEHHKSESVEWCVCLLLTCGRNEAFSHGGLVYIMTRKTITAKTMVPKAQRSLCWCRWSAFLHQPPRVPVQIMSLFLTSDLCRFMADSPGRRT